MSLRIRKCESSKFILFKIVLSVLVALPFCKILKMSISLTNPAGNFTETSLNLLIRLGRINIFTVSSLLIQELDVSLNLFRLLISYISICSFQHTELIKILLGSYLCIHFLELLFLLIFKVQVSIVPC